MLVSHRKRFIYTKTEKTASTSIEIYFKRYCWPEGDYHESPRREETVTDAGIVGARGPFPEAIWYNHMPATRIRELLETQVWDDYFKFTSVRNPFSKLVSGFYMLKRHRDRYLQLGQSPDALPRQMSPNDPIFRIEGTTELEQFRSWIKAGGDIADQDKYLIGNEVCVDFFIRHEHLADDLREVCQRLAVPFDERQIPQYKTRQRQHHIPIRKYYDLETEQAVRETHRWEFERFEYQMPGPEVF